MIKKILFCFLCLCTITINAQIITTIAGNGTAGYIGDGGQATVAELKSPGWVTVDASGNLFIADELNNCIRKVTTLGIISTLVGNGTQGYSGDGGQASLAQLYKPSAIAIDVYGNLYISEYGNNCVRKVNTAGIITTVAGNGMAGFSGDGGQATAANLRSYGVAVDAVGNIYIADGPNSRVRKVNTLGIISTIAGNGTMGFSGDGGQATAAMLNYPQRIVVDAVGNIFISDASNNRIRKIDNSGAINTVAGNGTAGYTGDGGFATSAQINTPLGINVDVFGNLYISDRNNNRIRKVNTSGIISTIAGNGTGGFSGDGGQATAAELNSPEGLSIDASNNLYIADFNNNRIRKVTATASVSSACNNLDFEAGNTSGWTLNSGNINGVNLPCDTCPSHPGGIAKVVNSSTTYGPCVAGIDTLGGFPVVAPNGGNYSLLLNDISIGGKIEAIKQTFLVTSSNAYFTYRFAAVLQDGAHPVTDQPYFNAEVLDQNGNVISCTKYEVSASSSIPGWLTSTKDATVHYKPWTAVFMNLTAYIGTNVTLKFVASDCNQGAHYGYAYVDASCSSSNPFIINYPAGCGNYPITITAPEGGFNYSWSGSGITGSNTVQTVTVSAAGTYSVTLKNISDTSCHFSISTNVQAISIQPTASFTNGTACVGATNFINLSTNNPQNSLWKFGDGTFSTFQNPTHIYTAAGNYTVTLVAINSCGKDSIKRVITVNPSPSLTVSPTSYTVCSGSSVALTAAGASTYSWGPAQGLSSTNAPTVAASPAVATVYTVMGTSSVGCSAIKTVTLSVSQPTITAAFTPTNPLCYGSCNGVITTSVTSGIGSYTYFWNTSATTSSLTNLCAGNYTVTIKNTTCGTQLIKTLSITTPAPVAENITHSNATCIPANGAISITASGGTSPYTYAINTGTYSASNSFTALSAGTYTVFTKDSHSCLAYSLVTISQSAINNPTITVTSNPDTICSGDSIKLSAQGATTYTWIPSTYLTNSGSASVVAYPPTSITYTVVGSDVNNCKSYSTASLIVLAANSTFCATVSGLVNTHNAFSPNNDGLNDLFIIDNITDVASNHVYIYNRWGQLLWDKSKYDNTTVVWDGKTQEGVALYSGTYFYVIEMEGQTTLKGWVELTK